MVEFDFEKWQEEWKACMLDCAEDAGKHLVEWLMDMLVHSSDGLINDAFLKTLGLDCSQARDLNEELSEKLLYDEHFRQQVYDRIKDRFDSMRK